MPAGGAADGEAALLESLEGETETGVVDAQALAEGGPGERLAGVAENGAHRLGERGRRGGGTVDDQREGLVGAACEAQQERVGSGSGAVLDGELQTVVGTPHEVAGGVGPGMQIGGAAQGLAEIAAGALGHVVDEDQSELIAAVDGAQKAEQGRDIRGAVFIEGMESDQGVQQQECGADALHGVVESELVALGIEAQPVSSDDLQVEAGQIEAAVAAQVGDAVADAWQSILGEIHQGGSGGVDREPPEGGSAGRDRDGEVKAKPGLTHLWLTSDCPHSSGSPEVAHQPLGSVGLRIDGMDRNSGQRCGHGHSDLRAAITSPALTVVWEDLAARCRAARARRSMARRLPRLISKMVC